MRDIKRIDRIVKKIGDLWKKHPDQRFYQMMINENLIRDDAHWNIEDDKLEEVIDHKLK